MLSDRRGTQSSSCRPKTIRVRNSHARTNRPAKESPAVRHQFSPQSFEHPKWIRGIDCRFQQQVLGKGQFLKRRSPSFQAGMLFQQVEPIQANGSVPMWLRDSWLQELSRLVAFSQDNSLPCPIGE